MTDANTEVISELNNLAERRFQIELRLNDANRKHKSAMAELEAAHEKVLDALNAEIAEVDSLIAGCIRTNRKALIAKGKQSFVIMRARFQFRGPKPGTKPKTKVTDAAGIMAVARRLGVIRKIAKMNVSWRLNQSKFLEWLEKHAELGSQFEDYLDVSVPKETLTMYPNSGYTVYHDSQRVSPPPVSIRLS